MAYNETFQAIIEVNNKQAWSAVEQLQKKQKEAAEELSRLKQKDSGATKEQIALAEKKELNKKLEDFKNERDTMEEVFENKEQIEISKYYERQPKPDLVAISEFENDELFYRKAKQED